MGGLVGLGSGGIGGWFASTCRVTTTSSSSSSYWCRGSNLIKVPGLRLDLTSSGFQVYDLGGNNIRGLKKTSLFCIFSENSK